MRRCPVCDSKRVKRYGRVENDYICKPCGVVFIVKITSVHPATCDRCGRIIEDYTKAHKRGSGKDRHNGRCRRPLDKNLHLKEVCA